MLIDFIREDIFTSTHRHVVFAVNAEGQNEGGFAGLVARHFWIELTDTGRRPLGTIISRTSSFRTFHAVVCHTMEPGGWAETPMVVERALNILDIPLDETIGVVFIGGGPVGKRGAADTFAILGGIARSNKRCKVYSL